MIYLLDTHVLIWSLMYSSKLSNTSIEILENKKNTIFVSAISFWEISLKHSLNKFDLLGIAPNVFPDLALQAGFEHLPLLAETASNYHKLNATWHKDPFDRMLIWQAIQQNFTLISKDANLAKYSSIGLKVIW
ncbi:type II toxin-antitoxin system VapC family toxin [Pedobacter changchengzhani]|uniref:Type II toxin-antitoxin system VapC family toxin n=1 Tax=Pedobacter changchengzhani TaxID=2529274 RepID=A0A4R5MHW1_9SPHI|nr:type II toxin-antitoxin system VapC family toxin [Pedobacter changchengzhani]TDG35124.1 type II toxin-antitoxin system VapC family toxin [Pedobacter changchengzhani]